MTTAKTKKKTATSSSTTKPPIMVLVVTHYYASHGGGIERVAERLIKEIAPHGNIHITWAASDCDEIPVIKGVQTLPMKTSNRIERWCGIPWPVWSLKSLSKLRKAIRSTDIVWLHDTLYMGNIWAFRMARARKIPIAITQHIGPIPYRNVFLRLTMKLADKIFSARMLKRAQEVIFISDRVAEDYYQRVPFTRAIKVIPNGVDLRTFQPPIPENRRFLREQFALKRDQPVF
ncbi:MAG: glycosyltransferase, partial [Bdellovibrionales bacterium]